MRFASAHGRARKRLARGELDLAGAVRAAGMEPAQSPSDGSRAVPRSGDAPALATPSFMKEDAAPRDLGGAASRPATNDVPDAAARSAVATPIPVERYASLVVELRLPGANRAEVLGRHALGGEEELAKLQGALRQAFLADPGLRARYEALVMRISAERR
jgi:hypothetical protein